jgi:hypothetical protein
MSSIEIIVDPSKLETIADSNCIDNYLYQIKSWINRNYKYILGFIFLCVVITVVSVIALHKNPEYPCLAYSPSTLASEVSVKCLQFLWTASGCIQKGMPPISDSYNGYYLHSPAGANTVKCDGFHSGKNCGIGSYDAMRVAVQLCNYIN